MRANSKGKDVGIHGKDWGLRVQLYVQNRKSVEESGGRGGWRGVLGLVSRLRSFSLFLE